jgi:hypothetical protein
MTEEEAGKDACATIELAAKERREYSAAKAATNEGLSSDSADLRR